MKDKRILILGIFILMALATTITYAYFSAKIIGSETESTLVFDAGTLGINLDGGNTLNGDKMIPGDTPFSTKKFTVIGNNNSNGYMPYSVNLVVDENTYSEDAISYTLELVTEETDNNGEPIENRENTPINYTDIIGSGYFTKGSNIKHTYLLKMYFLDTQTDQSADMKARFNAHIEITGNRASKNKITVTFDADGGELETLSKEVVIGSAYGNLPTPTKEGYEFLGWNGKNLLNKNDSISPAIINETGLSTFTGVVFNNNWVLNTLKPSTVYTIYYDVKCIKIPNYNYYSSKAGFRLYSGVSSYSEMNLGYRNKRFSLYQEDHFKSTFTTVSDLYDSAANYRVIAYTNQYRTDNIQASSTMIFSKIHLEEGTEATEYEPYYIDKYTKVVQYENHTLKAIWKEI